MGAPLLPVHYDPSKGRLFGQQPLGGLDLVEMYSVVDTGSNGTLTQEDAGKILEIAQDGSHAHRLLLLYEEGTHPSSLDRYPPNSEYRIVNTGTQTLEIWPYAWKFDIKSPYSTGLGLAQWGQATLRRRGTDDWIITGDIVTTNSKSYAVTPNGTLNYVFNGEGLTNEANPTISMKTNQELIISINSPGHPFWFKLNQGTGQGSSNDLVSGSSFPDGKGFYASNNGAETGTIKFRPAYAGTYYYNCQYHAAMAGQIVVTDA